MAGHKAGYRCKPSREADPEDAAGAAVRFIPRLIVKMLLDAVF
jgi:hypothetical protein